MSSPTTSAGRCRSAPLCSIGPSTPRCCSSTSSRSRPPYIHEAIVRTYISNATHRGLTAPDLDQLAAPWLTDDGRSAFYRQIVQYDERYLVENERRIGELDLPVRV